MATTLGTQLIHNASNMRFVRRPFGDVYSGRSGLKWDGPGIGAYHAAPPMFGAACNAARDRNSPAIAHQINP
jgi:hypothetical protein